MCWGRQQNTDETKVDKKINKEIRQEVRDKSRTKPVKILLLGAGDSGKSTLAKQMKILFLNGYTEDEKRIIIPSVHANVLGNIKDILKGVQKYKLILPPKIQELATEVLSMPSYEPWTPDLVTTFRILLMNSEVQKVLKKSAELQLYEHMEYMLSRLDEFVSPAYIPSIDDILRVKVRTTGITEIAYQLDGYHFTVVDMGGQRSERRKWIFFFEDTNVNRMQESLGLFKNVINNEFLKDTAIILFLNKIDLFKDKIQRSDLRECFKDYTGGPNYDNALKFIGDKFRSFDMSTKRNIFTHPTCATDTDNIKVVLNDVRLTLIQTVLREIGILILDLDELINVDGIPRENLTFKINTDDLQVDWDDELGSGSFAQVFRGFYLWTEVAIKKMILPIQESEKGLIKYFKREVILLNLLKHPNIVQFLGWCHPEDSNYILLVEEYIKGGTLHNFICKKTSKQMWGTKILLCSDVAKAMLYLHKNNIVYRDLKCDNILVDDSNNPRFAKLVDFGFARTLEMEQKGPPLTICGTDDWMAPEVIMGVDYDQRSDVFSFGVVLLECILGTDAIQKQLQRVANNCFELNMEMTRKLTPASCPEELIELTLSCCAYDPNARPDFNEILTGLTNAFRHLDDSIAVVSDVSAENSPIVSQRNSKTTHSRQRSGSGAIELSRMIPSDDEDDNDSSDSPKSSSPLNPSRSPGSTLRKSTLMTQSSPNLAPRSPHTSHEKTQQTHATAHASTQETHRHSFSSADDEADDLRRRISQNSIRALNSGSPRAVAFTVDQMPSELRLSSTSLEEKKEYIRVESLVDAHVWNVRVGTGATVADVCELLLKKIDANFLFDFKRYKFIELFQIHKKKKVSLFPEQFIDNIRSRWDGDLSYKFGVEYHSISTGKDWGNSLSKNSTIGKAFKKDTGKKNSKKKAMAVNFNMSPIDSM